MDWLSKELGLHKLDDWYQVDTKDINKRGGGFLLKKFNGKLNLLKIVYPEHNWITGNIYI